MTDRPSASCAECGHPEKWHEMSCATGGWCSSCDCGGFRPVKSNAPDWATKANEDSLESLRALRAAADRPSAATPEEVAALADFLDALDASGHTAEVLAQGGRSPFSEAELLDLGRRYMDAAYEDAAKTVEGQYKRFLPCGSHRSAWKDWFVLRDDTASAIRALIGGGE